MIWTRLLKSLIFLLFTSSFLSLSAAEITLSTEKTTLQTGETFRMILSAEGDFETINEPSFNNFDVENRSQSQSSSISIVNGKMQSKKSINYIYDLRADKPGVFKIGPASLKIRNGKEISSNVLNVTVTGSSVNDNNNENFNSDAEGSGSVPTSNSLLAPLTNWEKKTPGEFLRAVISPSGEVYEGEPVTVKYYLFTKPGQISDLNFYKQPSFENCWKEEQSETRLKFNRASIEGDVYDYGLLKTYFLIPEKGAVEINGTQMIVDIIKGSFFNTRKKTISTPAIRIPINELPGKSDHPDGFFGDMRVSVDSTSVTLDKNNLLETVTYTISGCGDLHSAKIEMNDNADLKIFSPEIELKANETPAGYCGKKQYKYMIKGLRTGRTSLSVKDFDVFTVENGWKKVVPPSVEVNVQSISKTAGEANEKKEVAFELLKELPQGVATYSIRPLLQRPWFITVLLIPLILTLFSFLIWIFGNFILARKKSFSIKVEKWKNEIRNADSLNRLLNTFYAALSDLFKIELKGERLHNLKRKYGGSIVELLDFIKEIEHCSYSADKEGNLTELKAKAEQFIRIRGKKR